MYGFNKKRGSKVENYYFHPMFKKGDRYSLNLSQIRDIIDAAKGIEEGYYKRKLEISL